MLSGQGATALCSRYIRNPMSPLRTEGTHLLGREKPDLESGPRLTYLARRT